MLLTFLVAASLSSGSPGLKVYDPKPMAPVYYSVPSEAIGTDGPDGSPFARGIASALKQNAGQPFPSMIGLLAFAARQASQPSPNLQPSWEGILDDAPLCPKNGPVRVHLVVQATYERLNALFGAERELLPDAFRAACPEVELELHVDQNRSGLRSVVEAVEKDAAESGGRTILYLSGHGAQIEGRNWFSAIDVRPDTPQSFQADSLEIGGLARDIGQACNNRCSIWVDASRHAQFESPGSTR